MKVKVTKKQMEFALLIVANIPIKNPVYNKIRNIVVAHVQKLIDGGVFDEE